MADNEYFLFDQGTYATMWSVEETTLNPRTHLKGEDGVWMYFISPDETKIYAVRRELFNTEEQAYDAAHRLACFTIEYGDTATIHHMTDFHRDNEEQL